VPSISLDQWTTVRALELNEIARAHAAVGGTARGRRYTTQQINRAFAMLLASQFQGFCRDLHSECVDHVLGVLAPPLPLRGLLRAEFTRGRQLDRGNAQSASLGADYSRLGIDFWDELRTYAAAADGWRIDLDLLNEWRNAIAHQDFASLRRRGLLNLRLATVRQWRISCNRLAEAMDTVMGRHLLTVTGASPW
jgi:hypothetical protein